MKEAIETLMGRGPADFLELCLSLGSQMLIAGGKARGESEARQMLEAVIADGSALEKLAEFAEAQGSCREAVYRPELLPKAQIIRPVLSQASGYVDHIVCDEVGICSLLLGGGRETKESEIDLSVGLVLCKKAGDYVREGEALAMLHANDEGRADAAEKRYLAACRISDAPPRKKPFIKAVIA